MKFSSHSSTPREYSTSGQNSEVHRRYPWRLFLPILHGNHHRLSIRCGPERTNAFTAYCAELWPRRRFQRMANRARPPGNQHAGNDAKTGARQMRNFRRTMRTHHASILHRLFLVHLPPVSGPGQFMAAGSDVRGRGSVHEPPIPVRRNSSGSLSTANPQQRKGIATARSS